MTGSGPRRPLWLLLLAAIGASLLVIVAVNRWGTPGDEHAYWLAARRLIDGQPLYDPTATIVTPYAYLYPPPLAQFLVPVAAILPAWLFDAVWTALMLVALWWLADRDVIRALAFVSFLPVAVEFWFRNVHLFLAVLVVIGLRRAASAFSIGAAIKVSPGLGIVYVALRGAWRSAFIAGAVGLAILFVSVALSPDAWADYLAFLQSMDLGQRSAFVDVPFAVRAMAAAVIVVVAARLDARMGAVLLVVAVTIALPSLWFTGLSLLIAAVPLWLSPPVEPPGRAVAPA